MNDTGMLYGVARYLPAGVKGTRAIAVSEKLYMLPDILQEI